MGSVVLLDYYSVNYKILQILIQTIKYEELKKQRI